MLRHGEHTSRSSLVQKVGHRLPTGWAITKPVVVALAIGISLASFSVAAEVSVDVRRLNFGESSGAGFRRLIELEHALGFTNRLSAAAQSRNRILENGSGVALGDVNGDGRVDLYFARMEGANLLGLNRGNWQFDVVPNAGGAACHEQHSSGVLFADTDGDGDLDLIVNAVEHGPRLFENTGTGQYQEVENKGLPESPGATSVAASDVDRDGDLDLYFAYYRDRSVKDQQLQLEMRRENGLWILPPEQSDRFISTRNLVGRGILLEQGLPDRLCLNDGQGRFRSVSWTDGFFLDESGNSLVTPPRDWALSVSFSDVNDDGFPDFYVCSDFISPDRFWLNRAGRGFRAVNRAALTHSSWSSMCLDWADVDGDGDWDFFVGDMLSRHHQRRNYQRANHTPNAWTDWAFAQRRQYMRNTFFSNRGNGSFAELGRYAGLEASEWTWNCAWLDVDRDGREDLMISNGHPHDSMDSDWAGEIGGVANSDPSARLRLPSLETENLVFRNQGGLRFEEVGKDWGFDATTYGQGMALGDLDGDGDRDLVVNPLNSRVEIYENIGTGALVSVGLKDLRSRQSVIGAKIVLRSNESRQMRELRAGGRYLSSDDGSVTFGVTDLQEPYQLEVRWPDGEMSIVTDVTANTAITLKRDQDRAPTGQSTSNPIASEASPLFEDISDLIALVHRDRDFEDGQFQMGLRHQLSRLSIGLGFGDIDQNGWDDLILGAGNGEESSFLQNNPERGWDPYVVFGQATPAFGDVVSVVSLGRDRLILAHSGYESDDQISRLRVVDLGSKTEKVVALDSLRGVALGALAAGDIDGDGDLDLFVGSRFKVGQYPQSAPSLILRNEAGQFSVDDEMSQPFATAGRVTSALFCHLNDDHWIDLVVAREWGHIGIFLNYEGEFEDASARLGVEALTGLWQTIDCGDFNADGRLDLVAGNWGRNRFPRPDTNRALRLYHGPTKQDRRYFALESYHPLGLEGYAPALNRDRLEESFPQVPDWFPTYRSYGEVFMAELGERLFDQFSFVEASTLLTGMFINQGTTFEFKALPDAVQQSVVMGLSVADWDGDGAQDVFVSQNLYETHLEEAPYDAGLGVLVRGDGEGGFQTVDRKDSGLSVFGAGRAAAVSDWNRDGRWDLFVARQGRAARFYQNRNSRPGVRVELVGVAQNPAAIGALLRLQGKEKNGPVQQIVGGGGDGGQDTHSRLLFLNEGIEQLWVRWPDGHETTTALPSGVRSVRVDQIGEILEWIR